MKNVGVLLVLCLICGCSTSAHDRRMRDSDDGEDGWKKAAIGAAVVATVAAVYYASKSGNGGSGYAQPVDVEWDWDQFYNPSYQLIWACRGVQTGQFADASHCAYKAQTDFRWPAK